MDVPPSDNGADNGMGTRGAWCLFASAKQSETSFRLVALERQAIM